MALGIYLTVATLLLAFLVFYSREYMMEWLSPSGAIIQNMIPGLVTMIAEVSVVLILANYLLNRQWNPTRAHVLFLVRADYRFFLSFLFEFAEISRRTRGQASEEFDVHWREIHRHLSSNALQQQLQYLTPAFTPDIARIVTDYMHTRREIEDRFRQIAEREDAVYLARWLILSPESLPHGAEEQLQMYFPALAIIALEDHLSWYEPVWKEDDNRVKGIVLELIKNQARVARRFISNVRSTPLFAEAWNVGIGRFHPPR